jgi:uncharacterized protein YukE
MKAAYNNPKYAEALRGFVGSMTEGADLSAKLMGVITGEAYTQSAAVQAILGNAKSTTLELLSTNATGDAAAAFRKVIENSVATGENFGQVLRNVRKNIEGSADFQGRMERYAKQNAYDFYSISQAQVINEMTEELGFEFYEYIGVDVKGTRSFCSERNNQIYHSQRGRGLGFAGLGRQEQGNKFKHYLVASWRVQLRPPVNSRGHRRCTARC